MPRTYRPDNTAADFGEKLEEIGGAWEGHKYNADDLPDTDTYELGGYSASHLFLAVSTLICAIITFAHRSVHLHDFLDKGTPCGGQDVEYYLGYYQNEGEQFFVVLAIVFAAVLMVELLARVAHVYPYEKVSPLGKSMFTWYRFWRVVEAVLEMTLVSFTVLSLYAEMRHDSDSKTGAGRLWKEAGCDASEGMSLAEAISPASIDEHASTIGAILVGVYLLVARVIGIEERHCDGLFNLDDMLPDTIVGWVNRGRDRAFRGVLHRDATLRDMKNKGKRSTFLNDLKYSAETRGFHDAQP